MLRTYLFKFSLELLYAEQIISYSESSITEMVVASSSTLCKAERKLNRHEVIINSFGTTHSWQFHPTERKRGR
jgi:hypothetical protein